MIKTIAAKIFNRFKTNPLFSLGLLNYLLANTRYLSMGNSLYFYYFNELFSTKSKQFKIIACAG